MNLITRRLMPKIRIEVTPESFTFSSAQYTFQLKTYLYLVIQESKILIAAIGNDDDSSSLPDVYRVDLFRKNSLPSQAADKWQHLEVFLNYGILKSKSHLAWPQSGLRPILIVEGIQTLESILNGYQQGLFERAAIEAGAYGIIFQ